MKHLEGLNEAQKRAVIHNRGPLLILAGAGAGKTKTLTHRILNLVKEGVLPENILAITFTNKAAKEMKERLGKLLAEDLGRPFVSTFHSLGVKILRDNSHLLGIPKHFNIYDRSDSISLIKKILKEIGEGENGVEPKTIISIISREKGNMVTHTEFESQSNHSFVSEIAAKVWVKYQENLKREKAYDFDDLLLESTLLLKRNPEIRKKYQDLWQHVHIDEYQDTNGVQYEMARCIIGDKNNVCVVGDIDQNIYSWRGATIKNILNFEKDFAGAEMIVLEQNYRSTGNILKAANAVIEKNTNRREKNLFTENGDGEKMILYNAFDGLDEARFVAEEIQELINGGANPNEIAILYRANFQSRILEEYLLRLALPYQVLGTKFFDRKEVKDILSFLRAAFNPDDLTSLGRIINVPARGIGKVTLLKILEGNEGLLTGKVAEKIADFRSLLVRIKKTAETNPPSETIKMIIKSTGMEDDLKKGGEEGLERIQNIKELATLAQKYDQGDPSEGIAKLLEEAALATDQDEIETEADIQKKNGVKLMTIHSSKGLEFDYVFITGLEQGLFPSERQDAKKDDEEEERRLFYVALTRARKKIFLSYAGIRTIYGSQQVNIPSEFLEDIPQDLIESSEGDDGNDVISQARSVFINW
ncbi:MAG: UvrD-helicase domain-containing protein [Candidatus Paceibacterota bacterium]